MRSFPKIGRTSQLAAALGFAAVFSPGVLTAEPVAVRYTEGAVHGFLVLRSLDGKLLANGDLTQTVRGDRVTARLVFRFKDGSVHDQTTVYTQRGRFRVISDRVVQRGPAFPQPLEMSVDGTTGQATVRYRDENGDKSETQHISVPADLANGIVGKLLMNARPDAMPKTLSLITATPTPRLVKLAVTSAGRQPFLIGDSAYQAAHYVLKVDIGGITGTLAQLFGKQPPDSHVWIAGGDVPAFVRAEQPLYAGGPVWRIELASPAWPRTTTSPAAKADSAKRRSASSG